MSNIDKRPFRADGGDISTGRLKEIADNPYGDEEKCRLAKRMLALLDEVEAKDKRISELKFEIQSANDRYENRTPTQWAYDQACLAIEKHRTRADTAEKRIAELEVSHGNLREAIAGIHNTIAGGGAYTPLAAILNASKRAYEESAAAAGKGE
ncbi:hypothetical protein [Enterobacter cancerogenus]|uniref:hypothetical protein n=1 Tax=Enterobacter cancerogenus TaxID=69218 RepID=UPI00018263B8|nr:hypothetical protein [Enterobacter cancerogenus]EFC56401.1 hypothetical protein ENTCAN_06706 [Enterobacter cancerogenus ATCC 35316]